MNQKGNETPDHLIPYEAAARVLCAKIGADPDDVVQEAHPFIRGATVTRPFWYGPAAELGHLSLLLTSLKEASASPKVVMQ
jgi:hypothetical protein